MRGVSKAALVCKRGPMGAVVFEGAIAASLDDGRSGPGFPIEVFNVLGAGDGFMSGLLRGWLKDEIWETTLTYANACGAFAVSRHGCAPAYPSWEELQWFLKNGASERALRKDKVLEQIHWSTNRKGDWPDMKVFAFDHRSQLEDMAAKVGAPASKIPEFKELCLKAAQQVRAGGNNYGILCDGRLGEEALFRATGSGLWIGRPVELPGSRPLELEIGPDLGTQLAEWPAEHVVKVLCFYHPDDSDAMKANQEETILRLAHACRENGLEFLLEVIPSKVGLVDDDTTATIIQRFYDLGVYPDWWKLEPLKTDAGWEKTCAAVKTNDPWCRGIVVLGLDAPAEELAHSFKIAGRHDLIKGFAVGRTIFAEAAEKWLGGQITDAQAITNMAAKFEGLGTVWDQARADKKEVA